jgi:HTH-type transcriptional regulator / antitoxin HipB
LGEGLEIHTQQIGSVIRDTRKRLGVTQKALALTSGTGLRFVIELEGQRNLLARDILRVLQTLGIMLTLTPPSAGEKEIMARALDVYLHDDLVGHLLQDEGSQILFD